VYENGVHKNKKKSLKILKPKSPKNLKT